MVEMYAGRMLGLLSRVTIVLLLLGIGFYSSESAATNSSTWRKWPRDTHEILLARHLEAKSKRCGRIGRPVLNTSRAMTVWFGIRLIDFDLDEKTNTLKLSVWVRYKWYADCLAWNPADFGGVKRIPFPTRNIWLPDITLVNTAEASKDERTTDVALGYTGYVFWAPHRVYKSACAIDVTQYPYDTQQCELWFQSMAKSSKEMDLVPYPSPFDLSTYLPALKERAEWQIQRKNCERIEKPNGEGMILMFSRRVSLRFSMVLKRRQGFFAYLLLLPCVFVSFLATVIFCLPPERPDRNTLGMNLIACLILLLLVLINIAPPSPGSIPILGLYYGFNMILAVTAVFLSTLVVNLAKRAERTQPVPECLILFVIEVLGRILWMRGNLPYKRDAEHRLNNEMTYLYPNDSQNHHKPAPVSMHSNPSSESVVVFERNLSEIEVRLLKMEEALSKVPKTGSASAETDMLQIGAGWRSVAIVLDRLFFCVFLILVVSAFIFLYPRP